MSCCICIMVKNEDLLPWVERCNRRPTFVRHHNSISIFACCIRFSLKPGKIGMVKSLSRRSSDGLWCDGGKRLTFIRHYSLEKPFAWKINIQSESSIVANKNFLEECLLLLFFFFVDLRSESKRKWTISINIVVHCTPSK